MKSIKEALLRLLEYLNNQDYINFSEITTLIEGNENEKQEYSIFIAFMRTIQVIPVLLMESTLKDFFNINMVDGSNGINVELKEKYKGTILENKLENFNKKTNTTIGCFFGIFRKIFYLNKNKENIEIVYSQIEIYELAESIREVGDEFIGSLDFSFKHTQ